ncbi:MAG: glycosyltransferase family 39 protein [Anaerolineales bacterium]|nr:glycosyltransferase family 39 protein [Anaerolineales bacterium]MCX7755132.1 glycosyltransferase family 39 protein [Anaerolineales bacterium]MDW8279204.1 glycosyltransferase family 39 protein [Anaerolineales bacterium]
MPRTLFLLLLLAFLLRSGLGLFAHFVLPQAGYGSETEQAGYLFFDAYRRDSQARMLAHSGLPLTQAFDEKFSSDQYGGLLWLSAFLYRYVNESPLTMVFLAALAGSLGGLFVYRAACLWFNPQIARLAMLIFLFYPDSILLGASQMREPFLMTLTAIAFYGITNITKTDNARTGWLWIALALGGMLFLSPGIALVTILALTGWVFFGGQNRALPWQAAAAGAAVFVLALFILAASWETLIAARGGSVLGILGNWARETAQWNADVLKRSSGIVQLLFESLPRSLVLPFVAGYGVLQPVLPAALIEPGNPFWQGLGILRALGWYLLLPLLAYSPFAALSYSFPPHEKQEVSRRQMLWLALFLWGWIVTVAVRGGGDQWDNPRYRVILLVFLAIVAAHAFYAVKTRWFWRIVWVEVILLLVFTHWYAWRYLKIGFNLGIRNTLLIALTAAVLLVAGDWLWQALRRRNTL